MTKERNLIAFAVVAVLAACGGGGGGGTASLPGGPSSVTATPTPGVVATPTPALPAGYAVDSVSITMAKGTYVAASARNIQAIGTGTESIVFTLLQQNGVPLTGTPQTFGLTGSSSGCTTNPNTQALTCVLPVNAPVGQDVFLAQTYSNANGTGSLTGSGAVALSVGINSTNTASIVLNAQVASVVVVTGSFYLGNYVDSSAAARGNGAQAILRRAGTSALRHTTQGTVYPNVTSTQVFVVAVDSSGNTILNPSTYSSPVYLQLAYDYTDGLSGGVPMTADVTLTATYAANDPVPCTGGSATAAGWYTSFALCSPSDIVTASMTPNVLASPSWDAYVLGQTNSNLLLPTPAPNTTPAPIASLPAANSFADIEVIYPTAPPGSITVIGQ